METECDEGMQGGEDAARREFIAIITLDGLTEAALHTDCLAPVCVEMCERI